MNLLNTNISGLAGSLKVAAHECLEPAMLSVTWLNESTRVVIPECWNEVFDNNRLITHILFKAITAQNRVSKSGACGLLAVHEDCSWDPWRYDKK